MRRRALEPLKAKRLSADVSYKKGLRLDYFQFVSRPASSIRPNYLRAPNRTSMADNSSGLM